MTKDNRLAIKAPYEISIIYLEESNIEQSKYYADQCQNLIDEREYGESKK